MKGDQKAAIVIGVVGGVAVLGCAFYVLFGPSVHAHSKARAAARVAQAEAARIAAGEQAARREEQRVAAIEREVATRPLRRRRAEEQRAEDRQPAALDQYRVVATQDISYAGASRMVFRVVVKAEGRPGEQSLKQVAQRVWAEEGRQFDEATVFCYLPDMNTSGVAYAVAEFTPGGLKEFRVTDFMRDARKKPASVERLPLETRKQVCAELLAGQDRADQEAERAFPIDVRDPRFRQENVIKYIEREQQLRQAYDAAVRRKHGITEDEQRAIVVEGVTKGWF